MLWSFGRTCGLIMNVNLRTASPPLPTLSFHVGLNPSTSRAQIRWPSEEEERKGLEWHRPVQKSGVVYSGTDLRIQKRYNFPSKGGVPARFTLQLAEPST